MTHVYGDYGPCDRSGYVLDAGMSRYMISSFETYNSCDGQMAALNDDPNPVYYYGYTTEYVGDRANDNIGCIKVWDALWSGSPTAAANPDHEPGHGWSVEPGRPLPAPRAWRKSRKQRGRTPGSPGSRLVRSAGAIARSGGAIARSGGQLLDRGRGLVIGCRDLHYGRRPREAGRAGRRVDDSGWVKVPAGAPTWGVAGRVRQSVLQVRRKSA
ncbi:hypothetical protein SAMN05216505_104280 [Streptomyces prasinopilosus]|uniref:Uncharacterized protein n=1 Tax=Streptomyces prasinopilosus TaxID=67344 RepID=A0A1G6QXX0_9ACTN|nr:hypothetical protein SAMN05216505_104280 [Streptomyces prasinopilosus]